MANFHTVYGTRAQERRRRLAFALDRGTLVLPAWVERALCIVVGFGHTPIHHYSLRCAWCDAKMPADAPDTLPRDHVRASHG